MRLAFLLVAISLPILLISQRIPSKPNPNKCYVRSVTLDVYETDIEEFLTYTKEEADLYPHHLEKIIVKPEAVRWESILDDECDSPNPDDCQVLCCKTYPAEYITIYRPKDESIGKPFYKEITRSFLVKKGGLTNYEKIDCELMSYQSLGPLNFSTKGGFQYYEERMLRKKILRLLSKHPTLRIQFQFRHSGSAPKSEAKKVETHLIENGANPESLVFQYLPDNQLTADELKIYWRVMNMGM